MTDRRSQDPTSVPTLGVYEDPNGVDWVIAENDDDAWAVWCATTGEKRENYDDDGEPYWQRVPDDRTLKMWCDADGDVGEIDGDGCELVSRTAGEWAQRIGRGFLGSTES